MQAYSVQTWLDKNRAPPELHISQPRLVGCWSKANSAYRLGDVSGGQEVLCLCVALGQFTEAPG